jgi:hypothetical protein
MLDWNMKIVHMIEFRESKHGIFKIHYFYNQETDSYMQCIVNPNGTRLYTVPTENNNQSIQKLQEYCKNRLAIFNAEISQKRIDDFSVKRLNLLKNQTTYNDLCDELFGELITD